MRPLLFLVLGLVCASFTSAQSNAGSSGIVGAGGGNITYLTYSLNQTSDRWFVFYGNTTSNSTPNQTIALNSSVLSDFSDNTRLIPLISSDAYYLISDSPFPFIGTFQYPNLSAFDQKYGLPSSQTAEILFNDTDQYSLLPIFNSGSATLSLPTSYLPGLVQHIQNETVFEQGLVQIGDSFIFVVPITSRMGLDGRLYNYMFVLPYSILKPNTFYVFSVVTPKPAPPTGSGVSPPTPNYQWSYNGQQLIFHAAPGTLIVVHDELGKVYNLLADANGQVSISTLPSGFHYTLRIVQNGLTEVLDNIYLPKAVVIETPSPSPSGGPTRPGPQTDAAGNPIITLQKTPQGTLLCVGSDCYLRQDAGQGNVQLLTDLSCTGSICKFVGLNQTEFIQKYQFKPTRTLKIPERTPPLPLLNLSELLAGLGPDVNSRFGNFPIRGPAALYVAIFLLVAASAALIFSFMRPPSHPKRRGGYG